MRLRLSSAAFVVIALLSFASVSGFAQAITNLCQPVVTGPVVVDDHEQVIKGGKRALPPITNTGGFGFAWPDTQMGVIKTADGYKFFSSDGGLHPQHEWNGHEVGNNKFGGAVVTSGTLDNPLGTGSPWDVSIFPNPDPGINPNYSSYTYIGGGPVFQVPQGMVGAGNLLLGYHAELPNDSLYAVHGLAASTDGGLHWTDLGEIVRPNQSYAPNLAGFDEIGDGPLVLSPDQKYFYFYFPDWPAGTTVTTNVSVARAPVASVLEAAFGSSHPHGIPFEKFYQTSWNLQPGIGGASTDLNPQAQYAGYLDVHYNSHLQRYVLITSNDTQFGYAESVDGLHWALPTLVGTYADGVNFIAPYPTSVGTGDDPSILGKSFNVYYLHLHTQGGGVPRKDDSIRRLTVTCP